MSTHTLYSLPIGETLHLFKRNHTVEISRPDEFSYRFNITNLADGKQQQFEFSKHLFEIFSGRQKTTDNDDVK